MNFIKKLDKIQKLNNSLVCVGLDSDFTKIPGFIKKNRSKTGAVYYFNKKIITATGDLICAYKLNLAFYEALGIDGIKALKKTIDYIKKIDSKIVIIADAKRGDIGSSNEGYAKAIFDYFGFDALTVHSFLGREALEPFLQRKNKGILVFCRSSNPGASEFQDLLVDHQKLGKTPLYKAIAYNVANYWNKNQNCGLIVGATYPRELKQVRKIAKKMPFLIPGIGVQGGDVLKTIRAGRNHNGRGMIINSSRGIIFASDNKDFSSKAKDKTIELKKLINQYRKA